MRWCSVFPLALRLPALGLPALGLPALGLCALGLSAMGLRAQGTVNASLLGPPVDDAAAAAARRSTPATIVQQARAAVVYVLVEVDGQHGKFAIERASSGVLVDKSGLVLTWHHLVQELQDADDKKLFVQLNDAENTRLPAVVEHRDAATGLALLRVKPPEAGLSFVELGPDRPQAGEPVLVVARPAGKEMLAFAGVASPALAAVTLHGANVAAADLFMTDSRNDERCDGAPVLDGQGRLLGLYASEHVQRDISEPSIEELKKPSFGLAVPAGLIRKAFAKQFAGASAANKTLAVAPAATACQTAAAVRRIAPSVVSVWCGEGDWPQPSGDDPGAVQRREGLASGVVLGKKGLVVTNAHVCTSDKPRIRTGDGRTFDALVVKRHTNTNLALLQVALPAGTTLAAADCNADDDAILGEIVLAVGNPAGGPVVVTVGVVSARRDREGGRVQADANLGNQNGGGAIVDATGRLLGIGDAGQIDPLEVAFAMRGDRVSTETNLSTFVGIGRVRKVFASVLEEGADLAEPIRTPAAVPAADRARRESPLVAMVKKAGPAMLNIYLERNVARRKEDDPFPPDPKWVPISLGSGVIIDRSGLALSNWHVVDEATRPDGSPVDDHQVTARVFGGKGYKVKVLSISREDDLSLLQLVLDPGEEVQAIELGSSDALAIGENVAAIGNPHGQANTITFGVVSAKDQELKVRHRWAKLENLIETDAAINGGNSGGALLDMNGRLVGINSAGGGTFNNKGYAIAVDHVRKQVLGLLFAAYKLRSPELGLRVMDEGGKVFVLDVDDRGPAARAGVKPGDRVVSLGGVPITWSPGFAMELAKRQPGVELELSVDRGGTPNTFRIAPLAPEVWSVIRQSGLQCRNFAYAEDPERSRAVAIGLHRKFTGDATGEPTQIPEQVVVVDKVFAGEQPESADIAAGDFILAVELISREGGNPVLLRLADVGALRTIWNERELGSYEGELWQCWVARGSDVRKVEIKSRRLFW
ncbi:MAG TPA: trypsin-like peptidase domain-containing protein [Planctomycetota bacterium]